MLRDYQQELYQKTWEAFCRGYKRPLVVAPCGAGKSYLFAEMIRESRGEALVLTHRRELLEQHQQLLADLGITNARVAMILTEANRLGQYPTPALIVTDEAHLSRSNSWMKVLEYYDTYTVGFTATPVRLDGKPLGDIYDTLIEGVDTQWLIEHNRLAPFEYYAPVAADTGGLRTVAGDYVIADLEQLMCERAIYGNVIDSYSRLASGERTIAYCVSVKHARETADAFNSAGVRAEYLSAGTSESRRRRILDDFRAGTTRVLCNVGIISEGISIDEVSCCLLLRPTESLALYWQQAMRCMRYLPGKTAKIIDCVGNYTRNPIPGSIVDWNLEKKLDKKPCLNLDGDFYVRVCQKCYKTFKTAPVCPYCGAEYQLAPREIKAHEEIKLARISVEEAEKVARKKEAMHREVQRARTYPELARIARERGYSQGWVYNMMKARSRK